MAQKQGQFVPALCYFIDRIFLQILIHNSAGQKGSVTGETNIMDCTEKGASPNSAVIPNLICPVSGVQSNMIEILVVKDIIVSPRIDRRMLLSSILERK